MTSRDGSPLGKGSSAASCSCLVPAHIGMPVGPLAPPQNSHQADDHNTDKRMLAIDFRPRIFEFFKMSVEFFKADRLLMLRHGACLRDEKCKITEQEIPNQTEWRNPFQFTTLTQCARWPWASPSISAPKIQRSTVRDADPRV